MFNKNIVKITLVVATLSFTPILSAYGQEPQQQSERGGESSQRKGPPKEAFTVCEGKSVNSSCTVTTPHGKESGTCQSSPKGDGMVACVPEGHSKSKKSR